MVRIWSIIKNRRWWRREWRQRKRLILMIFKCVFSVLDCFVDWLFFFMIDFVNWGVWIEIGLTLYFHFHSFLTLLVVINVIVKFFSFNSNFIPILISIGILRTLWLSIIHAHAFSASKNRMNMNTWLFLTSSYRNKNFRENWKWIFPLKKFHNFENYLLIDYSYVFRTFFIKAPYSDGHSTSLPKPGRKVF